MQTVSLFEALIYIPLGVFSVCMKLWSRSLTIPRMYSPSFAPSDNVGPSFFKTDSNKFGLCDFSSHRTYKGFLFNSQDLETNNI